MWKKQDDAVDPQPDFAMEQMPDLESVLIESHRDRQGEKGKFGVGPQKFFSESHNQPSSTATMATYTEAVNEFTRSATAFIEHLPLLTKARDAYEQAMRASAELRKILDAGDEDLRTLMTPLEQVIHLYVAKPAPDKKKPELAKVEAIRGPEESAGGGNTFP